MSIYIAQSVKKPTGSSPGAASPKNPNVTLVDAADIIQFPKYDEKGVKMIGNFVLKEGAQMIQVYMTASTHKPLYESEGEEDAISFKHKFEGSHPGDSLEINEFIQNWMGRDVIVIYGSCNDEYKRVLGTPCAPLQLKPSSQDDNEARRKNLLFEQFASVDRVPGFYQGDLAFAEPETTGANITASKSIYRVNSSEATAPIKFTAVNLDHGSQVTLIGSGGTDPFVLGASEASDPVTVFLANGSNWTALKDSVIHLQVFKSAGKTILFEVGRN